MGAETGDPAERESRLRRSTPRHAIARLVCLAPFASAGCALSPSVNILGSFFPAWLISIVTGLVLALVVWRVLVATGIAPHLTPPALVYPCLVALLIFASWLVLFGG
jgi:YtcA-like protein